MKRNLNHKAAVAATAIGAILAVKGCKSPENESNPRPMPGKPLPSEPIMKDEKTVKKCPPYAKKYPSAYSRVIVQVHTSSSSLRNALGAGHLPMVVTVRIFHETNGNLTATGASATCGTTVCPKKADIIKIAGIDLDGLQGHPLPEPCYYHVPVSIRY